MRFMMMAGLILAGSGAASAQNGGPEPGMAPLEQYLIPDRDREIALARSAAPPAISGEATVLVLTRQGYETAARGTNGFVCLVDRNWQAPFALDDFWNPRVRAPVCLNPQAARSVLPVHLKRTELALAGRSRLEMMDRVIEAYRKGELPPLEPGAMAYMMSSGQHLDDQAPRFQPHLMYYAPSTVTAADWGANLPSSPVLLGPERLPNGEREPLTTFVVPVARWSDGTEAPAAGAP